MTEFSPVFEELVDNPVVEAICRWTVDGSRSDDLKTLAHEFRSRVSIFAASGATFGPATDSPRQANAYKLTSESGHWISKVTPTSLTVSRIQPYEGWSEFRPVVFDCWRAYREVFEPSATISVLLRFLSVIPALESGRTDELLAKPHVHVDIPKWERADFFHQTAYRIAETPFHVSIVEHQAAVDDPLFLDISVVVGSPADAIKTEEVARHLDEMRAIKNQAFFKLVSDAALERYRRPRA